MGIDDECEAFRSIIITRMQGTNLQVIASDVFSSDILGSPSFLSQLTFIFSYKLSSQLYKSNILDLSCLFKGRKYRLTNTFLKAFN